MLGILVVSHGNTAEGLLDSLTMFFGENIESIDYLSLKMNMGADEFGQLMDEKLTQLDDGDGVLVMADLKGGTPGNQAMMRASDKVKVIFGVNLPILMELLAARMGDEIDIENLVLKGKESIISSDTVFASVTSSDDDDEL